jgi:hypothetical protein
LILLFPGDYLHPKRLPDRRILGEWGGEGCGIARVPGVDHALMNGTNGLLISGKSVVKFESMSAPV